MRIPARTLHVLNRMIILIIALIMLPVSAAAISGSAATASAAATDNCLNLSGTIVNHDHVVNMHQPIAMEYAITPSGTYTETLARDPVEISLVLDVSGSMNREMIPHKTNPTRLQAMKTASVSLINELKAINQGFNVKDRVALINFSSLASELQGLSSNYNDIQSKVNALSHGGETNIEDGLNAGAKLLVGSPSAYNKYIILLTDGAATAYRDTTKSSKYTVNHAEAKRKALQRADAIALNDIPVFTIAFGSVGSADIDHSLLETISARTGGIKYNAASSDELANVFTAITQEIDKSGQLANIVIKQKLPAGFTLADGNANNISLSNGTVEITFPPIQYPFTAPLTKSATVMLKQMNSTGEYKFEDADLLYANACGANDAKKITNPNTVKVTGWIDRWGNLYTADSNGAVTRYKHGVITAKQFTVPGNGKLVNNITFANSKPAIEDDGIVIVEFGDGTIKQWDLRPSAPTIVLRDANHTLIADSAWHKGKGEMQLTGSIATGAGGLPSDTDFSGTNGDFSSAYLLRYEYQINSGAGESFPLGDTVTLNQLGKDIHLAAQALTTAISGDAAHPTSGFTAQTVTSLDQSEPVIQLTIEKANTTDTNPLLKVNVRDPESPVNHIIVTIDGVSKSKDFSKNNVTWNDLHLADFFPDVDQRKGWKKISIAARNEAGLTATTTQYDGRTLSNHFFVINPGPSGELKATEGVTSVSNKPVVVTLDFEKLIITARADGCSNCAEIKVKNIEYTITTTKDGITKVTDYQKLGSNKFQITNAGTNTVTVRFTDDETPHNNQYISEPIVIKIDYDQKRY